jgi:alginate O-acetyltransferase complex protein AlgJ
MRNIDSDIRENTQRPLSREDIAQIEVGHTEISSRLARFLTVLFCAAILLVPAGQHVREFLQWRAGERPSPVPQAWDILRSAYNAVHMWRWSKLAPYDRVFAVNRELSSEIKSYENRLKEAAWLTHQVLPPAQLVLSRVFGAGNEQTYLGREGWLFYRSDIESLTGPGFLDARQIEHRAESGHAWTSPPQPDPVQAIVQFHAQLAAHGIELLLLPVPGKASVHPAYFTHAFAQDTPGLHNPSYRAFLRALEAKGIRVFDPTDRLAAFAHSHGTSAYLATDTHWTPAAMESIAAALAEELRPLLPAAPTAAVFRRETALVTQLGDLGQMLKLPSGAGWPARETVEIHPVRPITDSATGVIDPAADVLLLGDSFVNIYALESMGWGTSAGLAEHLALALNRPVDTLRRNDAGAYATREMLALELARGCNRLADKKVVVWEFAARELAKGDWKLLDLSPVTAPAAPLCGAPGLRTLTGTHTRMVWMRAADPTSADPFGRGDAFRLMGIDTDDGRGVREILPGPLSCRKPLLTPDGQRVVFTDTTRGRIVVVDWDGAKRRYLTDGFATDVRTDPETGRTWVYAITGPLTDADFSGKPLIRFDLAHPEIRETVWDQTEISPDNFQISDDGRQAAGLFPWPQVGVADLHHGTWTQIGQGCWTSLAPDKSGVVWFFDGAHRNLLFTDPAAHATWTVPISQAPGVGGFEVYHPRWGNHRQFFSMSGPYKVGEGDNRIRAGGREVEIYAGRFSADLRRVERWVKVTTDEQSDFFPDLWVDPAYPPAFNPDDVEAPSATAGVAASPIVVDARLTAVTRPPTLQSIAPYRQALVVYAYEIVQVHQGTDPGPRILVQHWALRNDRTVAPSTRVGDTVRLAVEPFDAHPELQGERVMKDMEDPGWPMFYEPPR